MNKGSDFDIDIHNCRHMLESLGNEKGLLGLIFNKSQNKFQDPSKLRRLFEKHACLSSRSFSITHLLAVTIHTSKNYKVYGNREGKLYL